MEKTIRLGEFLALLYADIFDFPLTKDEMHAWSISPEIFKNSHDFKNRLPADSSPEASAKGEALAKEGKLKIEDTSTDGTYFCLKGRKEIFPLRPQREKVSQEKKVLAQKMTEILKVIPPLRAVFLTGNAAAGNSQKNDDIDLFLVTRPQTVWATRLSVIIVTSLMGARRKIGDKIVKDKLCLNMFVDEEHLAVPGERRGVYTAHEVLYAKPLWDRGRVHKKFLEANEWVKEYLPIAYSTAPVAQNTINISPRNAHLKNIHDSLFIILNSFFRFLDPLTRFIQLKFMAKHRTTEIISGGYLKFHPADNLPLVEKTFTEKLQRTPTPSSFPDST